jgi:aryl-alcohol dehydrogenase-like predicted oxidoreductase
MRSSAIGFGCASLGSRVSKTHGLRALSSAFDKGVNWFDIAPAYGAGEAEAILGEFVRGRRNAMMLCTKVGRVPPSRSGLCKAAFALARPVAGLVRGLRKQSRRMRMARNQSVPLSPQFIRTSIERSLIRLNTDYIDVFALHEPSVEALSRDDLLETLEDVVREGKARYVAVAGSYEAARTALGFPHVYGLLQLADNPVSSPIASLRLAAGKPLALVSHSVLGVDGALDRIVESLGRHPEDRKLLQDAGYAGPDRQAVADLLIDRALASNSEGVVLTSMFSEEHQARNVARASKPIDLRTLTLVERLIEDKVEIESGT